MTLPATRAILRAGHEDRPCKRWFHFVVHESVEALRLAADDYGRPAGDDCVGLVHGVPAPGYRNGYAGIVRLCRGWLTSEVVSHEMTHAALVVYRQEVGPALRMRRGASDNEELLAYWQGILLQNATNLLVDRGFWRDFVEGR